MKRSEMVKNILKVLKKNEDCTLGTKVAKELLDVIEAAGMVPPMIREKSFICEADGRMSYAVHEWEPE